MALIYHELNIPLDTDSTFDYIVIKQGDAGSHKVRATLINNNSVFTIPTSNATYYFKFRKPDNTYVLVQATVSNNQIIADVTEEMLRVAGTGRGEFMIVQGSTELKTATFYFKIVQQTYTTDDVISSSDFATFASLLAGAGNAASNANAAAAAANTAAANAAAKADLIPDDYTELVQQVEELKDDLNDKANSQAVSVIIDGYTGGENLFDPSSAVEGQALISNGSTVSTNNKFVSDYMSVLSNYEYKYKGGTTNTVFIASYDRNKTFISGSFETGVSTYTTPINAKYVRITDYLVYKSVAQFYAVSTDGLGETVNNLESVLDLGAISEGDPLSYVASYNAFIMNDGRIIPTSNTLFVVRKYAVEKDSVYAIKGTKVKVNYDAYALASFSTSDYTGTTINSDLIIYGSGGTSTNYYVTFTAPANGYIYLLLYDVNLPKLELYDAVLLSKLMYKLTNANKDVVKIQAFGDSITDDSWRTDHTTWLTLLPDYLPQRTLSIKNEGVGGSHIGHGRVNSDTGKYHELEYNYVYDLMTNADVFDPASDIIVMFVGTNDFNSSPLGQWGDSTVDTFYGATKMVCEYISQNTSALFLVVTPIARPDDADSSKQLNADGERVNGYGATLRDYAEALIKTCSFYQFPVIDLFHGIGWNKTNVRAWLDATGVHPSVKGSNAICAYISSEIKKHLGI